MPDRILELCLSDGQPLCTVRVPYQSAPPPVVVFECRYFYRCFDWRYRETRPVVAVLIDPVDEDDDVPHPIWSDHAEDVELNPFVEQT